MFSEKSPQKLMLYGFLLFLVFFGLIRIFAVSGGYFFQLELLGLLFLLFLSLLGFIFYRTWGERVFLFLFLFYLINLILIWYFFNSLHLLLIILAVIGFLISIPGLRRRKRKEERRGERRTERKRDFPAAVNTSGKKEKEEEKEELHSQVFEPEQNYEKTVLIKKAKPEAKSAIKVLTRFTPGKYVASKNSNTYHEPKCDWAKKIAPNHRIWFKSKEDAWEKQYKAHECVK